MSLFAPFRDYDDGVRTIPIAALVLTAAVFAGLPPSAASAAPRPYHVRLEANLAAPFPFLAKFGSVTLDVYPRGVRADTFWLDAFSTSGSKHITVQNPLARMYTNVPIGSISGVIGRMQGDNLQAATPVPGPAMPGTVKGVPATRHRLVFGPEAFIDIWTTSVVPENAQLRSIVDQLVAGISPPTAAAARRIRGMPVYVELNFRRFRKLPLLRLISIDSDESGAEDALRLPRMYFEAPLLDALWK